MKYYHRLYMSERLMQKKQEIIYKLEHDEFQLHKYVIVLSSSPQNQLELYHVSLLLQNVFRKEQLFVVGIADGFEEALFLVEKITQEVYDETQGADIRTYLLRKQKEFEEKRLEKCRD